MELQKGQKVKLLDVVGAGKFDVRVCARLGSAAADVTCFGVDQNGKLSDDRYFVFYNQVSSPQSEITMRTEGSDTVFSVDPDRLPPLIQKLVVTVAADGNATMHDLANSSISFLSGGQEKASYRFDGAQFSAEKALILCEIYRKDNIWRTSVVASGFNGGLGALLAHFGGQEVSSPAPAPAPKPVPPAPAPSQSAPPVSPAPPAAPKLTKISLAKSGDSHKISLEKNSGELHANLNWNMKKKGFFGGGGIDLDLACMYRLKTGEKGVVQALGNSFGSAGTPPYILLDQDDRTGQSTGGENMFFKRPELIEFAVVFAFIYEGVPNWRQTDAKVLLKQSGNPDIEIHIDSLNNQDRFCVIASLSGQGSQLEVKKEDRFFKGHREVDDFYHFGFRWVAGRK